MAHLIDKDALVAEINQRVEDYKSHKIYDSYHDGLIFALEDLRDDFIDTLEVKEVDLEKELEEQCKKVNQLAVGKELRNICRHFFELGLKAKNLLTWEDMMLIHKCIKDAMNYHLYKMMEGMEGQKVVYEEVLKRFKAQKGE